MFVVNTRFPEDENTWSIDRQFLFGPSLMVSPALEEVRTISAEKTQIKHSHYPTFILTFIIDYDKDFIRNKYV